MNHKKTRYVGGVPTQAKPFWVAELLSASDDKAGPVVFFTNQKSDHHSFKKIIESLVPEAHVCIFPEWDTLPYDRVSPSPHTISRRLETLLALRTKKQVVVLTSMPAAVTPTIPQNILARHTLRHTRETPKDRAEIVDFMEKTGYVRVDTVKNMGEFAIRGSLIDAFFVGEETPMRLDFFDEALESIKSFDPDTQVTTGNVVNFSGLPTSEIVQTKETIDRFRTHYRERFGAKAYEHPLYKEISEGHKFPAMEQWLPLFYEEQETLLDYLQDPLFIFEGRDLDAFDVFFEKVEDAYQFRQSAFKAGTDEYAPLPPSDLYVKEKLLRALDGGAVKLSPFRGKDVENYDARPLPPLMLEGSGKKHRYTAFKKFLESINKLVFISTSSEDMTDTIAADLKRFTIPFASQKPHETPKGENRVGLSNIGAVEGFEHKNYFLFTEAELYGKQQSKLRQKTHKKKARNLVEISSFEPGDYLIHEEHGIGIYLGLEILKINQAEHDCVALSYQGGDKLYVPVENLYILSFYASKSSETNVDRLGGTVWQKRRESAKKKIKEIAEKLSQIAAGRKLIEGRAFDRNSFFESFCDKFPFPETEDQLNAIQDVIEDLASKTPMDRLICGDVGFGKTEVALRAAFIVAAAGAQVAILSPTTILAKQHYETFQKRFSGFPVKIALMSRFQSLKDAKTVREQVQKGEIDIIIGTHSLLSSKTKFFDLGLLIVDEEQHFGVHQKEKIKEAYPTVHVLALSATPIPRTMQMAVSGIRDLSLIATPPMERLPVETWVVPYDMLTIKEALLREKERGGQSFFVCPRVSDIAHVHKDLSEILPHFRFAIAHGQLPSKSLETVMMDFCSHKYDVLIATNIIESGLDIPAANTIITHRSDLFGLSQIYQLRGRVGRSYQQGYAYFSYAEGKNLTDNATRRLEVLESLKSLGGGFKIASYDMDIRGAGNIVGEEQSGQIKDVGVGLYHQMLEEALSDMKKSPDHQAKLSENWAPQINLGLQVFVPEDYIPDESLRFRVYRRLSQLRTEEEIQAFSLEMIDRFGKIPPTFQNLMDTISLRNLCKSLNVQKIDRGPKGILLSFYKDSFANIELLLDFVSQQKGAVKLRPDQKLVIIKSWRDDEIIEKLLELLSGLLEK